jgi:DNA-binding NtrC family response regulator
MKRHLLVVDDEADMLILLKRSLEPDIACVVETAASGELALHRLKERRFDLVLADIKMPGMNGIELLEEINRNDPELTVVMMTAHADIETAVQAMKKGAYDFITKPFDHDALVLRLEKAIERSNLIKENQRLQQVCREDGGFHGLVGKSTAMQRVYEAIKTVAKTDLTVLITGESGTGKDLTARAIHRLSLRSKGPYVAVNCPTVPEHILESELFGYRKGAFTHATQNKIGLFQEASGGTIFLDEIGDIAPAVQTKLLRVLQEKEIKPLGDTRTISVDVRIVASTNQNLGEKIKRGEFREDFFYRLNVLPIELPSLRDHREDIPLIATHLLEKHCAKMDVPRKKLSTELFETFMRSSWSGNVREMENLIIQGILYSAGDDIRPEHVGFSESTDSGMAGAHHVLHLPYKTAKEEVLSHFNDAYIGEMLTRSQGNVTQAAKKCGLERQALQQIMRRYGIDADLYRDKRSK